MDIESSICWNPERMRSCRASMGSEKGRYLGNSTSWRRGEVPTKDWEVLGQINREQTSRECVWKTKKKGDGGWKCLTQEWSSGTDVDIHWIQSLGNDGWLHTYAMGRNRGRIFNKSDGSHKEYKSQSPGKHFQNIQTCASPQICWNNLLSVTGMPIFQD